MRGTMVLAAAMLVTPGDSKAQAPMDALRPWVGEWLTEDTYYPEHGNPSRERGVRTCRMVLHDRYLQCETIATNARGVERSYWFLVNHNADAGRFEMLSVWSNVPFKAVHELRRGGTDQAWRVTGLLMIGASEENVHYSDFVFDGPDRVTWTGRRVRAGLSAADAPIAFVETWRRRLP